jgi:hypothetical protein
LRPPLFHRAAILRLLGPLLRRRLVDAPLAPFVAGFLGTAATAATTWATASTTWTTASTTWTTASTTWTTATAATRLLTAR